MAHQGIDKSAPLPYYVQLRELLSEELLHGAWQVDDQLPSEGELCSLFHVSRTVVRQALADLVHEGKLVRHKGKGTFVARAKVSEHLLQRLTGFHEEAAARGQVVSTNVLRFERITAPQHVADKLALTPGADVIVVDRLRTIDGEPRTLVVSYLPYAVVPRLLEKKLGNRSLYAVLRQTYGLDIASGSRTVEAVGASQRTATLLGIEIGAPILYLTSVSYLTDGRAIEYFEAQYPGDRSRFDVDLVRHRSPRAAAYAG